MCARRNLFYAVLSVNSVMNSLSTLPFPAEEVPRMSDLIPYLIPGHQRIHAPMEIITEYPQGDLQAAGVPVVFDGRVPGNICSADTGYMLRDVRDCADISDATYYAFHQFPKLEYWAKFVGRLWSHRPLELISRANKKGAADAQIWPFRDGVTVVAFRGSSTFKDIRYDIKRSIKPTVLGGIHSGFLSKLTGLITGLKYRLDALVVHGFGRFVFTGHSLGGALATIASAILKQHYPHIEIDLITFASPKVGDMDFAQVVKASVRKHYRLINEDDPIPRLPREKEFVHVPGATIVKLPSESHEKLKLWIVRKVRSHQLDTYAQRLKSFVQQVIAQCSH